MENLEIVFELFFLWGVYKKPDKAINDEASGKKLLDELTLLTGLDP